MDINSYLGSGCSSRAGFTHRFVFDSADDIAIQTRIRNAHQGHQLRALSIPHTWICRLAILCYPELCFRGILDPQTQY